MSSFARYQVGATGQWSGQLEDAAGAQITAANVHAATITLKDAITGRYIRGSAEAGQDILGGGTGLNGFHFADVTSPKNYTSIAWDIALSDIALVNAVNRKEEHVARIRVEYPAAGGKFLVEDHRMRCVDTPGLCTFEDVQRYLKGITEDQSREEIEDAIDAFAARAEKLCFRRFRKSTTDAPHTEVFSPLPGSKILYLERWPIDSIVSLKEAPDGKFDNATSFIQDEDYYLDKEAGTIEMRYWRFIGGFPGTVEVKYAGGLYTDTGMVDDDLRYMAARQAAYWFQRRGQLGLRSVSVAGGSAQFYERQELLPEVKSALIDGFKRVRW